VCWRRRAGRSPRERERELIYCGGAQENIANGSVGNGTSFSATTNYGLRCGSVGNRAQTNINGQLLWSSYQTPVAGRTYYSRTYYGAMYVSRHYYLGTSAYLGS
jgi:hypothetical protein